MVDKIVETLTERILRTHSFIQKIVEDLSEDDLCLRPSLTAPPIGWHLWHIVRWADDFQASFVNHASIWETDNLRKVFNLETLFLGPLETGMTMAHDDAALICTKIGKTNLFRYMHDVFSANKHALTGLSLDDLYASRESFGKWDEVDGKIVKAKGQTVTLIDDIGYHLTHANRHLGMIEALVGASLIRSGTASI